MVWKKLFKGLIEFKVAATNSEAKIEIGTDINTIASVFSNTLELVWLDGKIKLSALNTFAKLPKSVYPVILSTRVPSTLLIC